MLACPGCGGRLRLVALIEQAPVVQRILRRSVSAVGLEGQRQHDNRSPLGAIRCADAAPVGFDDPMHD